MVLVFDGVLLFHEPMPSVHKFKCGFCKEFRSLYGNQVSAEELSSLYGASQANGVGPEGKFRVDKFFSLGGSFEGASFLLDLGYLQRRYTL